MQATKKLKRSEVCIRELICCLLLLAFADAKSGINAIAKEPTSVDGKNRRGYVIPIAIPNCVKACSFVKPALIIRIGTMIATNGCIRLDSSLTPVMEADGAMTSL